MASVTNHWGVFHRANAAGNMGKSTDIASKTWPKDLTSIRPLLTHTPRLNVGLKCPALTASSNPASEATIMRIYAHVY
jgi:hypothetical protein